MTWIFTNISSISTVSFSAGVTRDVVNVWWTRERSAWAEISIRTGWIWVIGRGAGVYRISRLQQWEIMRGGAVLTSVSKDSSFVLPLWSMEPHNGDNDMHSHKLWRGDCRIPRLRFPALDTYSWNAEERNSFFFYLFHQNSSLFTSFSFSFQIRRLGFSRYFWFSSIAFVRLSCEFCNKNCESVSRDEFTISIYYIFIRESFYISSFFRYFQKNQVFYFISMILQYKPLKCFFHENQVPEKNTILVVILKFFTTYGKKKFVWEKKRFSRNLQERNSKRNLEFRPIRH